MQILIIGDDGSVKGYNRAGFLARLKTEVDLIAKGYSS